MRLVTKYTVSQIKLKKGGKIQISWLKIQTKIQLLFLELFIFMDISFLIHYNSLQFDGHLVSSHLLLEGVSLEMVEAMKKRSSECWCEYIKWSQIYSEVAFSYVCCYIFLIFSFNSKHYSKNKIIVFYMW